MLDAALGNASAIHAVQNVLRDYSSFKKRFPNRPEVWSVDREKNLPYLTDATRAVVERMFSPYISFTGRQMDSCLDSWYDVMDSDYGPEVRRVLMETEPETFGFLADTYPNDP